MVPRLAGQIYVMAGMQTHQNLQADAPGSFLGENVQFNGMGFQNEKFDVVSLDAAAFARWLAATKAQPNRLDPAAYEALSRRSILAHPLAFGAVAPGLFGRIVALAQPSGHALELKQLPPRPLQIGTKLP
jgi:cytochrome o ubiquinol oxidase subunit 2